MREHQNVTGVILAAGKGTRFFSAKPKQFTKLAEDSMLLTTIKAFLHEARFDLVIVVVATDHEDYLKQFPENILSDSRLLFVAGGDTRGESIRNALLKHRELDLGSTNSEIVIHDSCRPFVSMDHIEKVVNADEVGDAWVTFSRTGDAFAIESQGTVAPLEIEGTLLPMHTPIKLSMIAIDAILDADSEDLNRGLSTFLLKSGLSVKLLQSDGSTRKITFPEDGYGYSDN